MRLVGCSVTYRLSLPSWEDSAFASTQKVIDYQVEVGDGATEQVISREVLAGGISEIQMVEGADACYEIIDVRSILLNHPRY